MTKHEKLFAVAILPSLFQWYCHPKLKDHIEGDLIEIYNERVREFGKRTADKKFIIDVLLLFRPGIIGSAKGYHLITYGMYKNYG